MNSLLNKLQITYPEVRFASGEAFYWSADQKTVFYNLNKKSKYPDLALLHELSHALLGHFTYQTDFELLQLEVAAWEEAKKLATEHGVLANNAHIEDCLDSYRDWLHTRSTCPVCTEHGVQDASRTYVCLNCKTQWRVSKSRFCRTYRRRSDALAEASADSRTNPYADGQTTKNSLALS